MYFIQHPERASSYIIRQGFLSVVLIAVALGASGHAAAQADTQPAINERWVQSLRACPIPITSRCVLQAHQIYEEDHPNLVIYNHSIRRDFAMMHDPDETMREEVVKRVRERIASDSDARSKAETMVTFATHLRQTGRTDEAGLALDEAAELALAHAVPDERDGLLVRLVEELAEGSNLSEAEEMARKIANADRRHSEGLAPVAVSMAKAGQTREAEAIYSEIADHFLAVTHFPDWNARFNLGFALGQVNSEDTVDRLLQRIETAPPGDAWSTSGGSSDVSGFETDLRDLKREAVIARGAFPKPGVVADPEWLNSGSILFRGIAGKLVEAGEFEMAQLYFESFSYKGPWDDMDYFVDVALARLKREEFAEAYVSFEAAFSSIPKSPDSASYWNVMSLAELFSGIHEHGDKVGLSEAQQAAIGPMPCALLAGSLGLEVSRAERESDPSAINSNLDALLKAGCDSLWVYWLSDARLQEYASRHLLRGSELRIR